MPSRQGSTTEYAKICDSDIHLLKSLSLHQVDPKVPMNMELKSLQHEQYQMSHSSTNDRTSCERFEADSEGYFSLGFAGDSSKVGVGAPTQDMCPMCNLVFEPNCDLEKRRSHINSHFEN